MKGGSDERSNALCQRDSTPIALYFLSRTSGQSRQSKSPLGDLADRKPASGASQWSKLVQGLESAARLYRSTLSRAILIARVSLRTHRALAFQVNTARYPSRNDVLPIAES